MQPAQILITDLRIAVANEGHVVAMWKRTVIEVWRGVPTIEGAEAMMGACEEVIARYGKETTFIAVLERTSPPPPEPVRKVLARWSSDIVPRMAVAALVSEGGGFRAALVRGVGVALTVLAPHKVPFKFCATIDDGIAQLSPFLGKSGGGEALRAAIEQTRAKLR